MESLSRLERTAILSLSPPLCLRYKKDPIARYSMTIIARLRFGFYVRACLCARHRSAASGTSDVSRWGCTLNRGNARLRSRVTCTRSRRNGCARARVRRRRPRVQRLLLCHTLCIEVSDPDVCTERADNAPTSVHARYGV